MFDPYRASSKRVYDACHIRKTRAKIEILLVCYETLGIKVKLFAGYEFISLMSIEPSLARCTCQKSKIETLLVCYETWCTYVNMFAGYEFLCLVGLEPSLVAVMLTFMCFLSISRGFFPILFVWAESW